MSHRACPLTTLAALIALVAQLGASPASALIINVLYGAGLPPGSPERPVIEEAVLRWEAAIPAAHVVDLTFDRIPLAAGRLGMAHSYQTHGPGNTGIPRSASIDINASVPFFIDPTPSIDTDEFQTMIVSPPWLYPVIPLGPADGFFDLLTLVIHEIGHALGFSSGYGNFAANVVPAPTTPQFVYVFQQPATFGNPVFDYMAGFFPNGGVYLPQMEDDTEEGGSLGGLPSHIDPASLLGTAAGTFTIDNLSPTQLMSERRVISFVDLDILYDAYGFGNLIPVMGTPGLILLTAAGLGLAIARLRRRPV